MYVVTNSFTYGSAALNYILDKKLNRGVNIVAIGTPPCRTDRAGALALANAGIMLIGGDMTNNNVKFDSDLGNTTSAFFSATPRFGVQAEPLDNIIPVTTDPASFTAHGINSYYGGVPGFGLQSFAGPAAAAMATVAVWEYGSENNGQNPSIQKIKRAMMTGVDYVAGLNNRTITHDYGSNGRQHGGIFDLEEIRTEIKSNDSFGVSMDRGTSDWLGTTVEFDLIADDEPTNWTISWGDNSFDGSSVEVIPGSALTASHPFPFDNVPHHYFPTIYAMVGTGENRQVYLQESQLQVTVSTPFDATSGADHYTLVLDGDDRLFGDAGNDGIYGENGNDSITGGSGSDYMSGGAGNDDFNAQDGEIDTLDGGSGWDTGFIDFGEFIMDEEFGLETLFY